MHELKMLKEKVKDKKVLFADDSAEIRESTGVFLKKFFDNVTICADGDEALEEFNKNRNYNIIITDIKMPHMDGNILAKKIKEIAPEVFIIYLTASRVLFELQDELSNLCFKKPISFDDMKQIMQKVSKK